MIVLDVENEGKKSWVIDIDIEKKRERKKEAYIEMGWFFYGCNVINGRYYLWSNETKRNERTNKQMKKKVFVLFSSSLFFFLVFKEKEKKKEKEKEKKRKRKREKEKREKERYLLLIFWVESSLVFYDTFSSSQSISFFGWIGFCFCVHSFTHPIVCLFVWLYLLLIWNEWS